MPESAGWWPLTVSQAMTVPAVVLLATVLRAPWVPRGRSVRWAVLMGPLGAGAYATNGLLHEAVLAQLRPAEDEDQQV